MPVRGAVLGEQDRYGGTFGTLEQLHKWAFAQGERPIDTVPGTCALTLAVMLVVGGIVAFWPRRRASWARALRLDRRLGGLAWVRNLHLTAGVYTSIVVLVVAATGVSRAFDWAEAAVRWVGGSPQREPVPLAAAADGVQRLTMEAAWQQARVLVPDPVMTVIRYSAKPRAPVDIYMIEPDAPHAEARSYLYRWHEWSRPELPALRGGEPWRETGGLLGRAECR
ncbi:PepSY-associated TM helix domain-containing protein [Bradyrhizobium sp.]|uniref:PepSY-associated TM helix domain-containing protein n=1 Tax=Bradyrhizobium sp. TaxID=376 RepID=UPI0025BB8A18|nr:PepSY-associated TM helix domain-containing protein [Bradyrhizobium sp.]